MRSRLRIAPTPIQCFVLTILLGACSTKESPQAPNNPSVVGTWIRVYPREKAPDTLVVLPGGRLDGSYAGFESLGFAYTSWKIGDKFMPGGLCVGDGLTDDDQRLCIGFWVVGDTLLFGDGKDTAFLRAPTRGRLSVTLWEKPRGTLSAPVPADSVRDKPHS